jgi:hypothetical protein
MEVEGHMSKENILEQVSSERRRLLKRLVGGAMLLAVPASAVMKVEAQSGPAKSKGGGGKGTGKGKAKGKR